MTKLKIKAKIYQYTGIYLARNDEPPGSDPDARDENGAFTKTVLGMWQAKNGFHRYRSRIRRFRPRWLWHTICWLDEFWNQIKYDLGR